MSGGQGQTILVVFSDRTRGNGQWAIGTNWGTGSSVWTWGRTSSLWVTEHWNRLPREAVDSPSLRYSRPAWTKSCAACCRRHCFGRRVGLDDQQRSLPTPNILWFCDSVLSIALWLMFTLCVPPSSVMLCREDPRIWTKCPTKGLTQMGGAGLSLICTCKS